MEWLVEPISSIIDAVSCGHKCTSYCGTKDGCPIYACTSKGCSDYSCGLYIG